MTTRASGYPVIKVIAPRAGILDNLAYKVERLTPHPRRPERFHEDKSEIVAELRRLAREARRG